MLGLDPTLVGVAVGLFIFFLGSLVARAYMRKSMIPHNQRYEAKLALHEAIVGGNIAEVEHAARELAKRPATGMAAPLRWEAEIGPIKIGW